MIVCMSDKNVCVGDDVGGNIRKSVKIYENQQKSTKINAHERKSTNIYDNRYKINENQLK